MLGGHLGREPLLKSVPSSPRWPYPPYSSPGPGHRSTKRSLVRGQQGRGSNCFKNSNCSQQGSWVRELQCPSPAATWGGQGRLSLTPACPDPAPVVWNGLCRREGGLAVGLSGRTQACPPLLCHSVRPSSSRGAGSRRVGPWLMPRGVGRGRGSGKGRVFLQVAAAREAGGSTANQAGWTPRGDPGGGAGARPSPAHLSPGPPCGQQGQHCQKKRRVLPVLLGVGHAESPKGWTVRECGIRHGPRRAGAGVDPGGSEWSTVPWCWEQGGNVTSGSSCFSAPCAPRLSLAPHLFLPPRPAFLQPAEGHSQNTASHRIAALLPSPPPRPDSQMTSRLPSPACPLPSPLDPLSCPASLADAQATTL